MANMSYCRFENTYSDLLDCLESLDDEENLSKSERQYRKRLIKLCQDIAYDYSDDNDDDKTSV